MIEYRVETFSVKKAAEEMNKLAQEGWRVLAVTPNVGAGCGLVVTFYKEQQ